MSDKLEFKKTREFGEIINDTFRFVKENLKPLFKVFIYFCGFFVLATLISAIFQQIEIQKALKTMTTGKPDMNVFAKMFSLNYVIMIIFQLLHYTALTVSVLSYIALYIEKGNVAPSLEEVWAYFKYYFLRVMASSFVITLFMLVCFACCIVPGIYIFPAMSLLFPIMIMENGTLNYAFNRSFKLLRDRWWITAAVILVIYLIGFACMSFASIPAAIINMVGTITGGPGSLSITSIIISSTLQYVCQVFMIIPLIGITLLYFDLTERQESTGLMDRINQLGEKKADFNKDEEY